MHNPARQAAHPGAGSSCGDRPLARQGLRPAPVRRRPGRLDRHPWRGFSRALFGEDAEPESESEESERTRARPRVLRAREASHCPHVRCPIGTNADVPL